MTEQDRIIKATGKKVNCCSCSECKKMCRTAPCIGTPEDILKIINAGYIHKLQVTLWGAGIPFGLAPLALVAPYMEEHGCAFLSPEGLCELHDSGLKPTEGK